MTENYTQNDGSTAYRVTGLSVEILQLVCEKMNLTTVFLAPSLILDLNSFGKEKADLDDGISDVLTGIVPLSPSFVTAYYDATIPYTHVQLKILVPCPKAIPGTQKLITTFSMSVWLTMGLVLLLTTAVFRCAGNVPYRTVCNETHTYQSLSQCFYNAWAVLMAVSVPQQPTNSTLRVFFFLYVCFCFAISTVFQAFFVSYLVEPKYEKKLETLYDLLDSDVVYGSLPVFGIAQYLISYPELVKFQEHKRPQEDCSDFRKCVERMITKRDIAFLTAPFFATYVARDLGNVDVGKLICSLDETVMSADVAVLFKKGNPLLDRFNIIMRRYLEAGLLERLWTELQHRASLRGGGRFTQAAGDMFFAFSLYHLMPAFVALIVGTILSSAVFIAELILNCLCKRRKKSNSHIMRVRMLY
jgi:ABC-type amino acid transport substrate-binding protein